MHHARLSLIAAAALVGGCAVAPPAATPVAAPAVAAPFAAAAGVATSAEAAAAARPAAPPAAPGTPPPYAAVLKDARRIEGPLTLWQKDDKVWIELAPTQFGQPFLMSPKLKSGLGEQWLVGGLMAYPVGGAGGPQVVEFVRVHNMVRLQSRNMEVAAAAGTPEARAVEASYANSLLGSAPLASQPHPETKAVLVEANALFLSDILGVGMMLQRTYRQGYALDPRNSQITAVRGSPDATVIETLNHYYTGNLAVPAPPYLAPAPSVPRYVPDARSLLVAQHYSLMPLPVQPMAVRRADPRVGTFTTTRLDFTSDLARTPRERYVNRWRLEKKDPAAAMSEPVKPITFWIDRNVPLAYRDTVRGAILEWNKAFERIGFVNAIVVHQQPDDAAFDTLDAGAASVRWMMSAEPAFAAIGPTHVDPRTGEILDADIGVEGMSTRWRRSERAQVLASNAAHAAADAAADAAAPATDGVPDLLATSPYAPPPGLPAGQAWCAAGDALAEQAAYGLDVLAARDEIDPEGPQAQQFVLDYLRETVMHEVGHALGLRHNFRASRVYTDAQLSDEAFTREHGIAGSVMEYTAINLGRPGEHHGTPFQATLGPYDYWAIEYAYKPLPPAEEKAALQQIAARSSEPALAFGTDEDNAFGLDPETVQLDLGDDPIVFAAKRLAIARDLFHRQETRSLPPDSDYAVLRRSISFALADVWRAVALMARQIGGVRTLRDYPGSGRDPLQPVDPAVQRRALEEIVRVAVSADGLALSPALQRRLAPDYLERSEFQIATDFGLPQRLLDLQRSVVAFLLSEGLAARMLDSADKLDNPARALPLAEVYARLTHAVWSELDARGSIAPARRELQRDHVNRLAASLLRPQQRADARSALREEGRRLLARLQAATRRADGRDAATRAHLADSAETLRLALQARLPRMGL